MRLVALYHPKSDHGGKVEDYAHEYHMRRPERSIELLSIDTKKGWELAKLYDVVRYPAILAISDDGHLGQIWQEQQLPLMNELDAYGTGHEIGLASDYAKTELLTSTFA